MDVAVVGGGPAGAWTAYELARRGVNVTLFDASHPREKPCGGGVTGRALALVGDAIRADDLGATAIRRARFVSRGRVDEPVVALSHQALVVVDRATFDASLVRAAERAGARLCTERVVDVSADARGARITTRRSAYAADFLVGADGATSLVRRRVSTPLERAQLSIATGFFARGVTSDEIVIELTTQPPGYLWSFPRPDHLAVGICAQADAGIGVGTLRDRAADWIAATRLADRATLDAYAWPIPSLSVDDLGRLAPAGPRWCLVGDAAGLVDPITREGIFFALASAGWAAHAIGANSARLASIYTAQVHDEAVAELARAARLKAGFFRPSFAALLIHGLQTSARIRAVMADLVAGTQQYHTLTWRLIKTFEWRLAWRFLKTLP